MMDEYRRKMIDEDASKILEKIKEGKLYGEKLEGLDVNFMILAAYYLGRAEQHKVPIPFYNIEETL